MTVTSVDKDLDAMTMTVTSEFGAPIELVWKMWDDPRRLERWWGPPTYPATVVDHDLTPGGRVHYYMTGPEGDTPRGWWLVISVDPPRHLEFEDGFADDAGNPDLSMPTMVMRVTLSEETNRTRMVIETAFPSREAMEQLVGMGMDEGMAQALAQIDELLQAEAAAG